MIYDLIMIYKMIYLKTLVFAIYFSDMVILCDFTLQSLFARGK